MNQNFKLKDGICINNEFYSIQNTKPDKNGKINHCQQCDLKDKCEKLMCIIHIFKGTNHWMYHFKKQDLRLTILQ